MSPDTGPSLVQAESPKQKRRSGVVHKFLVDTILPIGVGLVTTVVFYVVLHFLNKAGLCKTLYTKLAEREFIPYICVFFLLWHLSHVLLRLWRHILPEMAVLRKNIIPASGDELTDRDLSILLNSALKVEKQYTGTLLTRRILLAANYLGISRNAAELGDLLRRRADADRHRAASAYAMPNFLFWAIPILGFVGTVLGIGMAVSKLRGSLSQVENVDALVNELGKVADGLGIAFDTTLVALLMAIVAFLVQTLVRQQESLLLNDVEDYLTYRLQSRIPAESPDYQRLTNILTGALKDLKDLQERSHKEQIGMISTELAAMKEASASLSEALTSAPEIITNELKESAVQIEASFERVRDRLNTTAIKQIEIVEAIAGYLEEHSEGIADDIKAVSEGLYSAYGKLAEQLRGDGADAVNRIAQAFSAVAEKVQEEVVRSGNIDKTLSEIRQLLKTIKPALEKLGRPIPLKLTLGSVEIPDAGFVATAVPPQKKTSVDEEGTSDG